MPEARPATGTIETVTQAVCAHCGGMIQASKWDSARWWHLSTGLNNCPEKKS